MQKQIVFGLIILGVVIALPKVQAKAQNDPPPRITGRFIDENEKGRSNMRMSVFSQEGFDQFLVATVLSDENGEFEINNLEYDTPYFLETSSTTYCGGTWSPDEHGQLSAIDVKFDKEENFSVVDFESEKAPACKIYLPIAIQ